jgi:hypothetical protein
MRRTRFVLWVTILLAVIAAAAASCSGGDANSAGSGAGTTSSSGSGPGSGGAGGDLFLDGGNPDGQGGGAGACDPPDVLILLDRTLTMHKTPEGGTPADGPDYASSKWAQAIAAIEKLVAPPLDKTLRFGLELWPKEADGCITLAERVENTVQATNPTCEAGEVVVPTGLSNGPAIQAALDPKATKICLSTPTGSALLTGLESLKANAASGRPQYVVLVTDGADWDQSCPTPDPLKTVQDMALAGVKTFVVGFSAEGAVQPGGVGAPFLNNMACAGHTAAGFPAACSQTPDGWVAKDPNGPALFLQASDSTALTAKLQGVAAELCCDCDNKCVPPDMMIALDRTLTMHFTPDGVEPTDAPAYASSKWAQAISAIEKVAAPPIDQGIRFGLELWPKEADGCITLAERVENTKQATNPFCEAGEILVEPAVSSGAMIAGALDPATTKLCVSTPTGSGLLTASDHLIDHAVPGRAQYILLVTDGTDWDQSCPTPDPLEVTQKLAAAGIKTFIVGFFGSAGPGGVGAGFLNDMACAGHTAKGFPDVCKLAGAGYVSADPAGPALYLQAGSGDELGAALKGVAAEVCCDCPK